MLRKIGRGFETGFASHDSNEISHHLFAYAKEDNRSKSATHIHSPNMQTYSQIHFRFPLSLFCKRTHFFWFPSRICHFFKGDHIKSIILWDGIMIDYLDLVLDPCVIGRCDHLLLDILIVAVCTFLTGEATIRACLCSPMSRVQNRTACWNCSAARRRSTTLSGL